MKYSKKEEEMISILYEIEGVLGQDDIFYKFDKKNIGDTDMMMKWYDHKADMISLTKRYPKYLFKLHGEGEDREDLWNLYLINGKYQKSYAKITITYPQFDPNELR
jgi:hypothetical protein